MIEGPRRASARLASLDHQTSDRGARGTPPRRRRRRETPAERASVVGPTRSSRPPSTASTDCSRGRSTHPRVLGSSHAGRGAHAAQARELTMRGTCSQVARAARITIASGQRSGVEDHERAAHERGTRGCCAQRDAPQQADQPAEDGDRARLPRARASARARASGRGRSPSIARHEHRQEHERREQAHQHATRTAGSPSAPNMMRSMRVLAHEDQRQEHHHRRSASTAVTAQGHLARALDGRVRRRRAEPAQARDVLDHDDRVVDEHAHARA